jgi:glycosyltransferase involved in cell wall biosynthesis
MASGTLAIGTRIPGILEQIEEGKTGFFAEPQDVPSLARCLEAAAALPAERFAAMSAAATEAGQGRSTDLMIARYRDVYRELLPR